ncbi:DUF1302 family protein [Magnetovibrio sp.]|uniref:DUF1302 family protein n=1 Tax=Magnetovibrio sp. TaxID=2024836 RepID=UPI002F92EF6A
MYARFALPVVVSLAFAMGDGARAQDTLDDILGGFDNPPPASPATPQIDDALQGFDDDAAPPPESTVAVQPPSPWSLSGSVSFSTAYDYTQNSPAVGESDKRGLSRMRPKATAKLKGNFPDRFAVPVRVLVEGSAAHELVYTVRGRSDYNDTVKNAYEHDINLGEAYVNARLGDGWELTAGRQIIVWGTSENLRVVDVINPLDRRELGMVDIEDVRLALAMARVDYVSGPWTTTALAIPHIRFNETAPAYSAYDPSNGAQPQNDLPADELDNAELAVSVRGNFSGWDLSLHAANMYDDAGHKEAVNGVTRIRHARVNMFGATGDVALGNWLLKGEAAHTSGLQTQGEPGKDFRRTDLLLGVEYSGLPDGSVSFEVVNRRLHGWSGALSAEGLRKDSQEYALRYSADFLHERLHVTALTTRLSPLTRGGGFSRASVEYDLQDALSVTGGVTLYHDGTRTPFKGLGDNDRVFFEIKQSF